MNKSFTILEVIVAIFVMTVGVLGAYSVVQQIIVYTSISSSRLTAAYLGKEGIEIVRNIRDNNWIQGVSWDNGLTNCAAGCETDYNGSLSTWNDPGRYLNIETVNGLYGYGVGAQTKFKRRITITPDGPDKLKIFANIEWTQKGKNYTVVVEEHLYNWY